MEEGGETKNSKSSKKSSGSSGGFKRGLSGKIATSSMGKSIITKNIMNDETKKLISCIKNLVGKVYDSKTGTKVENGIIKLYIKAKNLSDSDTISIDELKKLDVHIRESFRLSVRITDNIQSKRTIPEETFNEWISKIQNSLKQCQKDLTSLVSSHLSEKAITLIAFLFNIFSDEVFLRAILSAAPDTASSSEQLIYSMEKYLSFNLN